MKLASPVFNIWKSYSSDQSFPKRFNNQKIGYRWNVVGNEMHWYLWNADEADQEDDHRFSCKYS
ncbi:MAG: hypothetical protein ACFCU6_13270 [Balneolaceae bacterium]